jgi:hypothetical protein
MTLGMFKVLAAGDRYIFGLRVAGCSSKNGVIKCSHYACRCCSPPYGF